MVSCGEGPYSQCFSGGAPVHYPLPWVYGLGPVVGQEILPVVDTQVMWLFFRHHALPPDNALMITHQQTGSKDITGSQGNRVL